MICSAENAYRKFKSLSENISKDIQSRLDGFECEISCDWYHGDGLCVCFENLNDCAEFEYKKLYNLDSFVVPVDVIPKRGKIDVDFVLKHSI